MDFSHRSTLRFTDYDSCHVPVFMSALPEPIIIPNYPYCAETLLSDEYDLVYALLSNSLVYCNMFCNLSCPAERIYIRLGMSGWGHNQYMLGSFV